MGGDPEIRIGNEQSERVEEQSTLRTRDGLANPWPSHTSNLDNCIDTAVYGKLPKQALNKIQLKCYEAGVGSVNRNPNSAPFGGAATRLGCFASSRTLKVLRGCAIASRVASKKLRLPGSLRSVPSRFTV